MRRRRIEVIKDMSPDVLGSVYSVGAGEQGIMIGKMNYRGEEVRLVVLDNTGYTFYFTPRMVKEYLRFFRSL